MFEKVKDKISGIKEDAQRRRVERIRIAQEKAEEEVRLERERIQAEKDALLALSEKEIMIEIVLALKGYNTRLCSIEERQDELEYSVGSLELRVDSLESNISE